MIITKKSITPLKKSLPQNKYKQYRKTRAPSALLTASKVSNSGKRVACITRLALHAAFAGQAGGAPPPPAPPLPPPPSSSVGDDPNPPCAESDLANLSSPSPTPVPPPAEALSFASEPALAAVGSCAGHVISSLSRSTCTDCCGKGGGGGGGGVGEGGGQECVKYATCTCVLLRFKLFDRLLGRVRLTASWSSSTRTDCCTNRQRGGGEKGGRMGVGGRWVG